LHIHIITKKSLTFTESLTFTKHETHKKREKHKIVRTANYNCAYLSKMTVLIIFPVILQTVINLIMLSIGGQGVVFGVTPSKFMVPETRVFQAANGEDLVILACSVFD